MSSKKKFFLVDGSALAYRSYFAFLRNPLINSKGINTGAVFGFAQSLLKILKEYSPDYVAVVFDTKAPTFRHQIYAEYKSTRSKMPEEMGEQLPYINQVVEALNLPVLQMEGFEADDLMGTLAKEASSEGIEAVLVTGDKDFLQLVGKGVYVLNPHRAGREMEWIDAEKVKEKFGVGPEKVVDILALMGDQSDNIPGIPGVGEKTAVQLLKEFSSLEDLLSNLERVEKEKLRENIKFNADQARLSKRLATIDTSVSVQLELEKFSWKEEFGPELRKLFKELEFNTLLEQVSGQKEIDDHNYLVIDEQENLAKLLKQMSRLEELAIDTETSTISSIGTDLVGISLSWQKKEAYYLPLGHTTGKNLDKQIALQQLKPLFRRRANQKNRAEC